MLCEGVTYSNWPWGKQTCNLKFGSWAHDSHSYDLQFYDDQVRRGKAYSYTNSLFRRRWTCASLGNITSSRSCARLPPENQKGTIKIAKIAKKMRYVLISTLTILECDDFQIRLLSLSICQSQLPLQVKVSFLDVLFFFFSLRRKYVVDPDLGRIDNPTTGS